jgi:oleandomycin transport system permease protein
VCAGVFLANLGALQALRFIVFSTLCVVSNAFVPTQGVPGWLQAVVNRNPLSAKAAACPLIPGPLDNPLTWAFLVGGGDGT